MLGDRVEVGIPRPDIDVDAILLAGKDARQHDILEVLGEGDHGASPGPVGWAAGGKPGRPRLAT